MTTKTNIEAVNSGQTEREALPEWFDAFLTNVCEIPDRNSPDDEPEAIVATLEELRSCAINAIENCEPSTGICFFCGEPINGAHESDCPQREHCEFSAEGIKQIWKRVNGTHPDNGVFGRMVVDFGRALLADQSPAPASPSGEDAAEQAAELKAASERLTFVASINASYVEEIHALRDRLAALESAAKAEPVAEVVGSSEICWVRVTSNGLKPGDKLYTAPTAAHEPVSAASFALRALVAAGHVSQAKVDEAIAIARMTPGVDTAALAQPLEAQADARWQPIETAPKDGTPLILFARSIHSTVSIPIFGWFLDEYGWIAQSFHGIEKIVPSHWMPRPEFPAQKDPQ